MKKYQSLYLAGVISEETFYQIQDLDNNGQLTEGTLRNILGAGALALGSLLGHGGAQGAEPQGTQPKLTPAEKAEIGRNTFDKLKGKLAKDAKYNPNAAKVGVKADTIRIAIQSMTEEKQISPKLQQTCDLLKKIYDDKSGETHDDILKTLIKNYGLNNEEGIYFGNGDINPYKTLELVRDHAYNLASKPQ